jgi:hypothetical protein
VAGQDCDRRGGAQRVSVNQGGLSKSLDDEGAEAGDEDGGTHCRKRRVAIWRSVFEGITKVIRRDYDGVLAD